MAPASKSALLNIHYYYHYKYKGINIIDEGYLNYVYVIYVWHPKGSKMTRLKWNKYLSVNLR